jgi:N-methylhydantoinase A/oxoprolinase/acetone carboxylase beta subunit
MSLALGVDTGGTYTDAVLIRDERDVIASAKALTTRHDLALGIGEAVRAILEPSGVKGKEIGLAALSTTLATNALVEGQGGRVALVYVGFPAQDMAKHGLTDALKGDPVLLLGGGHDHAGLESAPLDIEALSAWLETVSDISAFAVAARFATRNPAHEKEVAEIIRRKTGRPVSSSHHLSARLNGPKRALTALLNARLIGMIDRLITRAEDALGALGIDAPMMVVRGDGALISAAMAKRRPIETILSGPAASIVGAGWLTDAKNALVSDIGGTTTDIALLSDGRPKIDPNGARVGSFRTMVEAVAMRTTGLGGDSEVHVATEGLEAAVYLGPRRLVPLSLLAAGSESVVRPVLEAQLRQDTISEYDGRFVRAVPGVEAGGLPDRDAAVLARIDGVRPLGEVLRTRIEAHSLRRLQDRGLVQVCGITPTDASHVLGHQTDWDAEAARAALAQMARRRTGGGERLAESAEELAQMIVDQLTHQTSVALLEAAFAEEDPAFDGAPERLAGNELVQRGLGPHRGLVRIETGLNSPIVGLGASAGNYYPAVGRRLGCEMILPEHGGVANAVGAVVGRVTMRMSGAITSPSEGLYRLHGEDGPQDFNDPKKALAALEADLRRRAEDAAHAAGAVELQVQALHDVRQSRIQGRSIFVEATITVEASGRPRIAAEAGRV